MKFVSILISLLLFIACKKDKVEQKDTAITLKRKWTLESFITKVYEPNGALNATYNGLTYGTTYDFQSNDILIVYVGYTNSSRTISYTIVGDSVNFDGYNHAIKNLTSTNVTLIEPHTGPGASYTEAIYNLKR